MMLHIGIDLGGTNIAAAAVDDNYKIVGRGERKTNAERPAGEILDDMAAAAFDAINDAKADRSRVAGCGIGSPGSVNPDEGIIYISNNLPFSMLPMKKEMEKRLNMPCDIANDANAAALGEMLCGAGRDAKVFVAVTLGTGVGGGVIINGSMLTGSNYAGGELGHMIIVKDGEKCTCGLNGCWEAYASASALIAQTKRKMAEHPESKMWEISKAAGGKVNGLTSFDGMRANDPAAAEVVSEYCEYVACGIINLINIFQPDVLCVGGGISREGETLLGPVRKIVESGVYSKNNPGQTVIKAAELGNDAGIIGAAFLHTLK